MINFMVVDHKHEMAATPTTDTFIDIHRSPHLTTSRKDFKILALPCEWREGILTLWAPVTHMRN